MQLPSRRYQARYRDLSGCRHQPSRKLATVAKCYRLLRAILNTAVVDEVIVRNPCNIKGAGIERTPERPVATTTQVWALADAVEPRFAPSC